MAENNSYTPENDLNLDASLTQDEVYRPENDSSLEQSLISVPILETAAATATATGSTISITGLSTLSTIAADSTALGETISLTGSTTLETTFAASTGIGGETSIITEGFTTAGAQAGGLGGTVSIQDTGFGTLTAEASATGGTGLTATIPALNVTGADATATGGETRFNILGRNDQVTVYINGTRIDSYQEMEIEQRLNEPDTFSFTAFITDDSQRGLIAQGNDIKIMENYNLLFKGRLEEVNYDTAFQAKCEGEGMETKLLDRKTGREEYLNTPADDIVRDIAPTDTVTLGTIEDAPTTSIRFDHDNKARGVAGVANAVGYDWRLRQEFDDKFDTDYLDFVSRLGSETPVETFSIGETARLVDDGGDDSFVANDITLLGRGDGINQLEARVYAAAADFTQLSSELTETGTTINVDDTTVFGSTGDNVVVKMGVELIDADIVDGTTLSINSRGVTNFEGEETKQILHRENLSVWLYENKTQGLGPFTPENQDSAQPGSSIEGKGVKQLRETDKTIIKLPTLEIIADRELRNRYLDVKQIEVRPTDPRIASSLNLGDTITIEDGLGADLNGDFRIVGMDHKRRTSGEGTVLHCANRPRRLVERLSEIERDKDTLNAHMQGATNFNGEHFEDNVDETHPLNNKIFVPEDVVAINKFELTFARESFRGYTESTDEESAHTHNVELNPIVDEASDTRFLQHNHTVSNIDSIGTHASGAQVIVPANTSFDPTIQHSTTQLGSISAEIPNPTGFDSNDTEEILFELEIANFGDTGDLFEWTVENEDGDEVIDFDEFISSGQVYNYTATIDTSGSFSAEPGEELTYYPRGGEFDHSSSRDATDKKSYVKIRVSPRAEREVDETSDVKLESQKSETSGEGGKHSHEMNYGIFEPSSEPDIDVEVYVDGSLVDTISNVSVGQEITSPIDLKEDLEDPLTGVYHDIELKPIDTGGGNQGRSRLSADITQKIFIESTL